MPQYYDMDKIFKRGWRTELEWTRRDEANAIVGDAFRNTFLEDLHAGRDSPLLEDDKNSRITDVEMRKLMIEASEKVYALLDLKQENPTEYEKEIRSINFRYCRGWVR